MTNVRCVSAARFLYLSIRKAYLTSKVKKPVTYVSLSGYEVFEVGSGTKLISSFVLTMCTIKTIL